MVIFEKKKRVASICGKMQKSGKKQVEKVFE